MVATTDGSCSSCVEAFGVVRAKGPSVHSQVIPLRRTCTRQLYLWVFEHAHLFIGTLGDALRLREAITEDIRFQLCRADHETSRTTEL